MPYEKQEIDILVSECCGKTCFPRNEVVEKILYTGFATEKTGTVYQYCSGCGRRCYGPLWKKVETLVKVRRKARKQAPGGLLED